MANSCVSFTEWLGKPCCAAKETAKFEIEDAHTDLIMEIKNRLKTKPNLDMTDFRTRIVRFFEPAEDISQLIPTEVKDSDEIFSILTNKHLWNVESITVLKIIAKRYMKEDEIVRKMLTDYVFKLNAYRATTKLIQRIQADRIKAEKDASTTGKKYDEKFRKKLSFELFQPEDGSSIELTELSMDFMHEIWDDACENFGISFTSILHRVALNCIKVSWFIPSISAQMILENIDRAVAFLQRRFISNVVLEGTVIYSKSYGVASAKVRHHKTILPQSFWYLYYTDY